MCSYTKTFTLYPISVLEIYRTVDSLLFLKRKINQTDKLHSVSNFKLIYDTTEIHNAQHK